MIAGLVYLPHADEMPMVRDLGMLVTTETHILLAVKVVKIRDQYSKLKREDSLSQHCSKTMHDSSNTSTNYLNLLENSILPCEVIQMAIFSEKVDCFRKV